jgi:SAM-dependent methyltransferase
MKRCLCCGISNEREDWLCPSCGAEPQSLDGFCTFAPELAFTNDGMDGDLHHLLDALQEKSFWFRCRNRLIADLTARYFPSAKRVLEVGCGTGFVLQVLQSTLPNAALSGSEVHLAALNYARERLGADVAFYQMDARKIPFRNEFDLICAFDVLEHIEEDEVVLNEMRQALKPGGGLLLSVPQHPALWSRFDEIGFHKRRYTIKELDRKCHGAGFTVLKSTSFVAALLPAMFVQRLRSKKQNDYNVADELTLPLWLDKLFERLLDIERQAIAMDIPMPFGGSRFVVARLQ